MTSVLIVDRKSTALSDWVTLVERDVRFDGRDGPNLFHSLRQADYVTVLAVTRDGRVPVVRQFRPALERETLELPGGLREASEEPDTAAARELAEEAGLTVDRPLRLLGCLDPDTGRLENRLWCYFAEDARPVPGWTPEPGVTVDFLTLPELRAAIDDGRLRFAQHVAIVGLAAMRGLI